MLQKVEAFIKNQSLLSPADTVIVGLSGGVDSMALLDVLTLLGYKCVAAHCNFHLRGEESNRDAEFVKKWCKSMDTEFTSIDFDTRQYAADNKISIEMAARDLRYDWFEIIRNQYEAQSIAVAHHKDDSVETVLMNMIRGTGIKGLTGISPKNGHVVRPLLCVSREEVEHYLEEREIPHIFDSSNGDEVFLRNAIRLTILPKLEVLNPAVREAIYRTSQNVTEAEKVYVDSIEKAVKDVFVENKISISKLKNTPSPLSVLFHLLSPLGFNPSVIEDIWQSIEAPSGKIFLGKDYRLLKDRAHFLLDEIKTKRQEKESFLIAEQEKEIFYPIHLRISVIDKGKKLVKKAGCLYADAEKIAFPLIIRRWKHGDWFIPFGMKGRKKLSDYFTDQKFSLADKEKAWILASGEDIVWIVGERSDERFRITSDTKKIIMMEILQEK